ncbi:hypothetical protein B0T26DRAFT_484321 [Lasiosphaeria miniovina]|uniref:Uncharacterized protein n=1 Tax=Lasiosphaeria miniovina TaxID=1954250 RepID=A0AA40A0M8_9PEZI|nr:uncharacterized protein B0T26DRAFT_484321 [Lasiosphaeria miniovina]KAK0707095.1 hypothetical protein B0T26DRAFT_484321 [Lasiosphaeria miniovina]
MTIASLAASRPDNKCPRFSKCRARPYIAVGKLVTHTKIPAIRQAGAAERAARAKGPAPASYSRPSSPNPPKKAKGLGFAEAEREAQRRFKSPTSGPVFPGPTIPGPVAPAPAPGPELCARAYIRREPSQVLGILTASSKLAMSVHVMQDIRAIAAVECATKESVAGPCHRLRGPEAQLRRAHLAQAYNAEAPYICSWLQPLFSAS